MGKSVYEIRCTDDNKKESIKTLLSSLHNKTKKKYIDIIYLALQELEEKVR